MTIDYEGNINRIIAILKDDSGLFPAVSVGDGTIPIVVTFDNVLYITDPTHYVTLRIISYGGIFKIPVSLSNITTVKEV